MAVPAHNVSTRSQWSNTMFYQHSARLYRHSIIQVKDLLAILSAILARTLCLYKCTLGALCKDNLSLVILYQKWILKQSETQVRIDYNRVAIYKSLSYTSSQIHRGGALDTCVVGSLTYGQTYMWAIWLCVVRSLDHPRQNYIHNK